MKRDTSDCHAPRLRELAERYADEIHNQKGNPDIAGAADRLMAKMTKRYGPHVVHDNKLATCIYLQRIE